jgi:hypothetical protein
LAQSLRTFLALDHSERDAIHEQNYVGKDEGLDAAWRIDSELIDGVELIVLRRAKIDQSNYRDRIPLSASFTSTWALSNKAWTASFASNSVSVGLTQ